MYKLKIKVWYRARQWTSWNVAQVVFLEGFCWRGLHDNVFVFSGEHLDLSINVRKGSIISDDAWMEMLDFENFGSENGELDSG